MKPLRAFLGRLRETVFPERHENDLALELDSHLNMLTDDNIRAGVSPEEARRRARIALGGVESVKENCRDRRRIPLLETLLQDLKYALRGVGTRPGFALTVVLILAIGIGANTAVFTVVDAVLLKPLPYRNADRIVTLSNPQVNAAVTDQLEDRLVSIPSFKDFQNQSTSFEALSYYYSWQAPVMAGTTAEYARMAQVSADFFRVFGEQPVLGRFYSGQEMTSGIAGAAVISYRYWHSHFGGDNAVLGRIIRVHNRPVPIVGVLPKGFDFPYQTDLWVPHEIMSMENSRDAQNDLVIGLLKPGISLPSAQAGMTLLGRRLAKEYPKTSGGRTVAVTSMRNELVGNIRLTLYLLLGAVGLVLLIACANTATLLLGKAMARGREVAIRVALGAGRRRIIRQLITESLLLSVIAGAAGLLLSYLGTKVLGSLAPAGLLQTGGTIVDWRVLAFTIGVSLLTSLLFGLLPALHASKIDLNDALKHGGTRSVTESGMVRLRGFLVVGEIALAVVLLAGAGLLTKSFMALQNVPLGFHPENVLVVTASVPATMAEANRFFKDVLAQARNLPGVQAAGATMAPPGHVESSGGYFIDHLPAQPDWNTAPHAVMNIVAPGTFAALGVPLTNGRDFSDADTADKPFIAVVNQALVRRTFQNENPIGRTIFCPFDTLKGMTIVGVVGDVRQSGPDTEAMPQCYMNYQQHPYNATTLSIVVRTTGEPTALNEALRRVMHERSPAVPATFTTMEAKLSENIAAPRFRTLLFGLFAVLAICLAMAGIYGVMAYAVGQRSNEIGLRMALGATTVSVRRLILVQGLILTGVGLALGLGAAAAGTRFVQSMLFEVQPNDPVVYAEVAVLLVMVAAAACYIPAWRASRLDPMTALRED
jgi:putative ABC transport system permease protein